MSLLFPESLIEWDPEDNIVVMVWHRDNEDGLMLPGSECLETLKSKVEAETAFSDDSLVKLDHLAARLMNELIDLGPHTAHMNQKPENLFSPVDRVVKAGDAEPSVGGSSLRCCRRSRTPERSDTKWMGKRCGSPSQVRSMKNQVCGVTTTQLSPRHTATIRTSNSGRTSTRTSHSQRSPMCHQVIKTSHSDPNPAVVVEGSEERGNDNVTVAFLGDFEEEDIWPGELTKYCDENEIKCYTSEYSELYFSPKD